MIKVTLGEVKTQEGKPFPKLMIANNSGRIVFFIEPEKGFQINTIKSNSGNHGDLTPHYSEYWCMYLFTDYNEPITIQNL